VDTLGNYDDAVDAAAELGGIEGEPYIVTYDHEYSLENLIWDTFGLTARSMSLDADALRRIGLPR